MNNRIFNIFYILLILVWIWADRHLQMGAAIYGWLLLVYVSVLFCGSYFIRMGFFMKSICSVKKSEKVISLSFDDGPAGKKTARILDILKDNNVEAAFFCIGKNMPENEKLLKRIANEGHIIGNHSNSHDRLFDLYSSRKMLNELELASQTCQEITGLYPRFFRPPYGVTNPNLKKAVLQGGFISIGWSIRSYDTVIGNEERLLTRILARLKPGAILLLHDTSISTQKILPRLVKEIRNKGYKMIRLDKMINLNPYD
ncbi:MAG TPA: polysaccharide deacetylase family protein [Puia sp.]|nr:polysaccharide deacetylase family protein [Puia sp.]